MKYWEISAEFDDGTTYEGKFPYTEDGDRQREISRQLEFERWLLSDPEHECVFYMIGHD